MIGLLVMGIVGIGATLLMFMVIQTARLGSVESAAESVTSGLPAISFGAFTSGLILSTELLLGIIGFAFGFPDLIVTLLLGVVGFMTLEGVITIQPETWALLTIAGFVSVVVLRG